MNPKVSIIIPVYNVEKYLRECLDSVLNQTLKDIEIICINDGSKDNSLDILKEYADKDSRLTYIDQENKGLGATRNVGIKAAKGDFVGFVDSDDFVKPEMFETLYNKAIKDGSEVVVSNPYIYNTNTKEIFPYRSMLDFYRLSELGGFDSRKYPISIRFIGCWDKLYNREFLLKNDIYNPEKRIFEDFLFSYKAIALADKVSYVKDCLYYYRKFRGDAITDLESKNNNYKEDFILNMEEAYDFLAKNDLFKYFGEELIDYAIYIGGYQHSLISSKKIKKMFVKRIKILLDKIDQNMLVSICNKRIDERYDFILELKIKGVNYERKKTK